MYNRILVTGGAGFIGVNFIYELFGYQGFSGNVYNLDSLTYAGNAESLDGLDDLDRGSYSFIYGNICDFNLLSKILVENEIDCVVHFAAESHVDRSIQDAGAFIDTNIVGTYRLLEVARQSWGGRKDVRFHHVSTDEVYGSLDVEDKSFSEDTPYNPRSPYSASKAASDHLVRAYYHTHGLPVTVTNSSNNYGPYQFPEKLIPLMIMNMMERKPLPIYGDGRNVRDWLYVRDHARALIRVLEDGSVGKTYNIGGGAERQNIELIGMLCEIVSKCLNVKIGELEGLLTFVEDRKGHDRRYSVDSSRMRKELGWEPEYGLKEGLELTVDWYLNNPGWIERVRTGEYRQG